MKSIVCTLIENQLFFLKCKYIAKRKKLAVQSHTVLKTVVMQQDSVYYK